MAKIDASMGRAIALSTAMRLPLPRSGRL